MVRRVFLHVGAPKTGTTYLQERIRANAELISEQGLTYVPSRSTTHFLPALDLIQRRWGGELAKATGAWDELVATAASTPGDVLISHEILAGASVVHVERAMASFADDEVHVVYTARDLARQVPAEWQETLKHRSRAPFGRFLKRLESHPREDSDLWFWRVQALPDVLTRWGRALPAGRVHLVTVPPAGADRQELWGRICAVLGLDPALEYATTSTRNASMGISGAAVVRRLNTLLPPKLLARSDYVELVREIVVGEVLAERPDKIRAAVPRKHRAFFDGLAEEWIAWVDAAGVDVIGDLDDLRPHWPQERRPHPDRPDPDDVADAAITALARMVQEAAERTHAEAQTSVEPEKLRTRLARRLRGSATIGR